MTDAKTICHDVDLLNDWLDAKGYTEEAGLCLRVLGLIHAQEEEIEKLRHELDAETDQARKDVVYFDELRAENEKLRAALRGVIADMNRTQFPQTNVRAISVGALNAAATALKETDG